MPAATSSRAASPPTTRRSTDIAKAFTEAELKAGVVLKRGKKNFRKVLLK